MQYLLPSALFLAIVAGGPLLALASLPAAKGDLLLVVLPPWRDAESVLATAGGRPLGVSPTSFAQLAAAMRPDFAERALRAGAWAVLDGRRQISFCGG